MRRRRGFAYIIVLGVAMIVSTLAFSGMMLMRIQVRAAADGSDAIAARQHAHSAIELGRLMIANDPNWRTTYPHGVWIADQSIGNGTFTLEVTDPIDGDLANRPHDPVLLTGIGGQGNARQVLRITLEADPTPLPALAYAAHTAGQFRVRSEDSLTANGATVSTNSILRNEGIIAGNVEADSASHLGTVTGTVTLGAPPKGFPAPDVPDHYAALGTEISVPSTMQRFVLAPGHNPWGQPNPDGVYVVRSNSNMTLRNCRIHGTLVVLLAPGRELTVEGNVLLQPARPDYPALIVRGDVDLKYRSTGSPLIEQLLATNFNPPGAPYQGTSNLNTLDVYPSEIQGLVHVTGQVRWRESARIRGALLCESNESSGAIDIREDPVVVYDPALFENPPQWYTTEVKMIPQPGGWRQVVD